MLGKVSGRAVSIEPAACHRAAATQFDAPPRSKMDDAEPSGVKIGNRSPLLEIFVRPWPFLLSGHIKSRIHPPGFAKRPKPCHRATTIAAKKGYTSSLLNVTRSRSRPRRGSTASGSPCFRTTNPACCRRATTRCGTETSGTIPPPRRYEASSPESHSQYAHKDDFLASERIAGLLFGIIICQSHMFSAATRLTYRSFLHGCLNIAHLHLAKAPSAQIALRGEEEPQLATGLRALTGL